MYADPGGHKAAGKSLLHGGRFIADMVYYAMNTGRLIREARLRAGLTQRELAGRAGTTQSSIARWEAGGVRPSLETLRSLVRACDLDLRVSLTEADDGDLSQLERTLWLSPEERLDELVRTVRFIGTGRAALESAVRNG